MKSRCLNSSTRGMALVLVLVVLLLLTGLLVAFFSSASLNRVASGSYASGAMTKQLADSAVSFAMGQIKAATSATNTAWASQPGMIRTYDDSGDKLALYKLYSSDKMVVNKDKIATFRLSDDLKAGASDAVTAWINQPAIFTDLNSPTPDPSGTAMYPIVDPTAVADGFSLANDPANNPAGSGNNRAPMPVKWLYVLKSGALTAPSSVDASGKIASWANSAVKPSESNPIVGRIAFWTDDDSCKINLNTASEPTPWVSPMAVTKQDLNYGKYQPAQKEFQRYPGHPFSTALSPVLFPGTTGNLTDVQLQSIYDLIPRVQWGGSKAATVDVATATTVTPDQDRLLASVDEALFGYANRTENSLANAATSLRTTLEKARFFLTTNSRAPEVNLFGKPRVSIWPISADAAKRTTYDKLAAFCSTIGVNQYPFYFQRRNAFSPTDDYANIPRNQELYKYLQDLTGQKIPGYGNSFLAKWSADRDQVLTEIFDYIRTTNLRDPLLVQRNAGGIPLIARQQTKVYSPNGQVAPIKIGATQGFGRFNTISQFGLQFIAAASTSSSGNFTGRDDRFTTDPSKVTGSVKLLPAGQTAVQAGFFFQPFSPSVGFYQLQELLCYVVTFQQSMSLTNAEGTQSVLFPAGSSYTIWSNDGFVGTGVNVTRHAEGRQFGGSTGIRGPVKNCLGDGGKLVSNDQNLAVVMNSGGNMTFSGGQVEVRVYSGAASNLQTTTAALNSSSVQPASENLIQTFTIDFPGTILPIPSIVTTGTALWRYCQVTPAADWWALNSWPGGKGRWDNANNCPQIPGAEYVNANRRWAQSGFSKPPGFKQGSVFRAEDVVRTMVPDHGDLRLIAASANPSSQFVPGNNYRDKTVRFDHLLSEPEGPHMLFGFSNEPGPDPAARVAGDPVGTKAIKGSGPTDQLVPSANVRYHYARLPEIRPGAGRLFNQWNDFDNGMGYVQDGAYINKPDEGNISSTSTTYPYFGWDFDIDTAKDNLFSPSRLVASAGMFGSLPTGVKRNQPWETLLFRPFAPSSVLNQSGIHPGAKSPKDHLIMDLFWMPVVEPYAISEPFSTAGKVNMNYQIAPFNYIRRATALYGAFKSEQPLVIPNSASQIYKLWKEHTNDDLYPDDSASQDSQVKSDWHNLFTGSPPFDKLRRPIDMAETLKQADDRFNGTGAYDSRFQGSPDIFRSATEICELHLVREAEKLADYINGNIWDSALVTGDNARERPYTNLYAKLTTRSNVYTIHMRVQTLQKTRGTDPTEWNEAKDKIVGEHRGSAMIERYLDPADPRIVDYATTPGNLNEIYKFRVLNTKKFP